MSSTPPTFYRAEIYEDNPYAWWPMDDQPGEGGVLPTTLLNAAAGQHERPGHRVRPRRASPSQDAYGVQRGRRHPAIIGSVLRQRPVTPPPQHRHLRGRRELRVDVRRPAVGHRRRSAAAGNPVEAVPRVGVLAAGRAARHRRVERLVPVCNDATFPGLSGGITVKGWFNAGFFGSRPPGTRTSPARQHDATRPSCGQPYSPITVCALATDSAPVAVLQLDTAGHLNLITYNGATGTSATPSTRRRTCGRRVDRRRHHC